MKRTTKSLIALLVLVAMCVSFCVPTFAVEVESHEGHADEAATCVCAGKTHTLKALGITAKEAEELGYLVKDEVDCINGGWSIYKCINCPEDDENAYFVDNYVEPGAAGHDFEGNEPVITEPTCTEDGKKVTKCNRCGKDVEEVIPATGHNPDKTKVEYWKNGVKVDSYLCTDGGVVIKTPCTNCNHVHEETYTGGEHDFDEKNGGYKGFTKEATCIEKGEYKEICAKCEYKLTVDVYVSDTDDLAKVHNWDYKNAKVYDAPKCNQDGKLNGTVCLDCGEKLEKEITLSSKNVPHDFTKVVPAKPATCFEDGNTAGVVCANCGAVPTATDGVAIATKLPKLGHKNAYQSEEDKANSIIGSCFNYGVKEAAPAGIKAGQFYAMADKVELTEANKGWAMDVYTCPDCDNAKYVKYTAPYEHLDKGLYVQEPTHNLVGLSVELCRVCGQNDATTLKTLPVYSHVITPEMVLQNKVPAYLVPVEGKGNARDCVKDGEYYYQCTACLEGVDCEKGTVTEIKVVIPALGHDFQETYVPATCCVQGYTWYPCQREGCKEYDKSKGIVYDEGEIPADAPHRFPETSYKNAEGVTLEGYTVTTVPTCYVEGQMVKICLDCSWYDGIENGQMNYVSMGKLTHTNTLDKTSGLTYAATCTDAGNNHYICTNSWTLSDGTVVNCDWSEDKPIGATGHSWQKITNGKPVGKLVNTVAPTCTTKGYSIYSCTHKNDGVTCGEKSGNTVETALTATYVAALGHTYKNLEKTRDNADRILYPTCDGTVTRGQFIYDCTRCDDATEGHTLYVNIEDPTDPDYDMDLNNSLHHLYEKADEANPHRESTCVKQGVHNFICYGCRLGDSENEARDYDFGELQPILNHYDFAANIDGYVAPECEVDGKYETFTCTSVCGGKYYIDKDGNFVQYTDENEAVIPATGHDMTEATCTTAGKCKNDCGATTPKLGHLNDIVLPAVPATCTTSGKTAGVKCSRCNVITTKQTTVPASKHKTVSGTVVDPTCDTPGYTPVSCEVCKEVLYFVSYLDENGHNFAREDKNHKDWKEPTCLEDGKYVYGCTDCDTTEREFVTVENGVEGNMHKNAAGQTFGATCVAGVTDYNCVNKICVTDTNPNGIECSVDDKTDVKHNYLVKESADCTIDRYTLEICQRCSDAQVTGFVPASESHELGAVVNGVFVKDAWEIVTVATLATKGTKKQTCSRCSYETEPVEYSANDGVQFDFDITNLKGEQEYVDPDAETKVEVYAGRVQLVITATAQNANLSSILLKLKFDNTKLAFVGGKLTTKQFEQTVYTFTDVDAANAKGIVNIMVESTNNANLPLASGDFAVLEFEILDKKNPGEITFTYDETTEIRDEDNGVVDVMPVESMPVAKTRALGKLTEGGEQIGLADFNKIVEIYQSGAYTSDADINMDGDITAADINEIRKNLIGNDSTLD